MVAVDEDEVVAVDEEAGRLRAAGMRVTSARLAILEVVRTGRHPAADDVEGAAPLLEVGAPR